MPASHVGLGPGLREPCPPNRVCNVFGAPLNTPNADWWNCLPQMTEHRYSFDLSTFKDFAEVVVCLVCMHKCLEGIYQFRFAWYRDRDQKLLFDFTVLIQVEALWECYAYSYIGYVPHEIWENGLYTVKYDVSGAEFFEGSFDFTITGVPEAPPTVPPPEELPPVELPPGVPSPAMFWDPLISLVHSIGNWFTDAANECAGWITPFNWLETPLSWIGNGFLWWAYWFSLARNWSVEVWATIVEIVLVDLPKAWSDFWNVTWQEWMTKFDGLSVAWDSFWNITWPDFTSGIGVAWDVLRQWVLDMLAPFRVAVDNLEASWDLFWEETWPTILKSEEIQSLINSAILPFTPVLSLWETFGQPIADFFSNPLDWLLSQLEDWFWGEEG